MHPPSDYFFQRAVSQLPEEKRKELEAIPPADASTYFKPKSCLFIEKRGLEAQRNPMIPFGQGLIVKTFTEEEGKSLRLACREHNTTIQAAAQTAAAIAMAKLLQDKEEWEPMTIKMDQV